MRVVKVGNAQGFWGDQPDAPKRLLQQQPDLDYLTLDYLAEVSLSIMAIQREKDPTAGYAKDFIEVIKSLIPFWKSGSKVKVICNAGGLNPKGCAQACAEALREAGLGGIKIGIVAGDDVLRQIKISPNLFTNLESNESASKVVDNLVTANAYLGAKPVVEALAGGAQIVISGRVADPSLAVAACVHHFGWTFQEYDKLAGATVAGHLIECGTQVTGGISNRWLTLPDIANIGYPVAEVNEDGSCVITKPQKTGGAVTVEIVKEQLLYEIGDPANYLSPDVTVSFLNLSVQQQGPNRVMVSSAIGSPPPSTYKVSACFRHGFRAEATLTITGLDAVKKAHKCGDVIIERVQMAGYQLEDSLIECIGSGDHETVLRVAVADPRKEAVETFTREIAPMVTSGPAGTTGYATGRAKVRPVFGYWPTLIEVANVTPTVEFLEVS
ncbi:MAG: acyclic terpene utilization AtuA family protein [Chlamydiales bacterium]|nr:acyclic terpene utilization AtuA family protein [Chlamydiales bacterium]